MTFLDTFHISFHKSNRIMMLSFRNVIISMCTYSVRHLNCTMLIVIKCASERSETETHQNAGEILKVFAVRKFKRLDDSTFRIAVSVACYSFI